MRADDFNLIYQPWIKVRTEDAQIKEVSLLEVFSQSHKVQAISGELPTQNAAILRLLLAVLYTVFSRMDVDGEPSPLESEDEALNRWQELWENRQFPMEPIQNYLDEWKDRFWLFDEKYPFYQSPDAKKIAGKKDNKLKCQAAKLNGEISQSGNKIRIFSGRNQEERDSLSYGEAARWLIHLIAYDDSSVKPSDSYKQKKKVGQTKEGESPGIGWLGKLGLVYAEGDNLFETLMLNLVFCPNGQWDENCMEQNPIWEWEDNSVREREKVSYPDNMAELLTFPSRYVLLERENDRVQGAYPVSGMFFDPAVPLEQMTIRKGQSKKKDESPYLPRIHSSGVFLWQEFESLFVVSGEIKDCRPGVVLWINQLQAPENHMIDREKLVRFSSVGMFYDSKKCSFEDIESDGLSLHAGLISELGISWRKMISEEMGFTEKAANYVGILSEELSIAESGNLKDDNRVKTAKEKGKSRFYEQMDILFRKWLCSISVDDTDEEEKRSQWREQVFRAARNLGRDLADNVGPAAYAGRMVQAKKNESKTYYSAAKSYTNFLEKLNYIN